MVGRYVQVGRGVQVGRDVQVRRYVQGGRGVLVGRYVQVSRGVLVGRCVQVGRDDGSRVSEGPVTSAQTGGWLQAPWPPPRVRTPEGRVPEPP